MRWRGEIRAALAAMLLLAATAPAGAAGLQWLGGDTVTVAAHRFDRDGRPSAEPLSGYLARSQLPGRRPAVVVLHGCAGFGTADVAVADVLASFGYTALALDSLGGENSCGVEGSSQAVAADAYAGLDWLARQDFANADRVAALGFSMGAIAVLRAVEAGPLQQSQPRHFRAAVAYYPRCKGRPGVMTAPTLILIGDKDDWTPLAWCRAMLARRADKGAAVRLVVYPGATHGFNTPSPARKYRGHHLEYNPQATADAWRQVRGFLHGALEDRQ